jgi:hypothetical protein
VVDGGAGDVGEVGAVADVEVAEVGPSLLAAFVELAGQGAAGAVGDRHTGDGKARR